MKVTMDKGKISLFIVATSLKWSYYSVQVFQCSDDVLCSYYELKQIMNTYACPFIVASEL